MVGGQERAASRKLNRAALNTPCFLPPDLRARAGRSTPFRSALNAGDMLGTVNEAPSRQLGATNQLSGVRGKLMHFTRDGVQHGSAGYTGNQKYVYDSSDYIRYRAQKAKLRTYNNRSFGGAGAGRGGIGSMALAVRRRLGPCDCGRSSKRPGDAPPANAAASAVDSSAQVPKNEVPVPETLFVDEKVGVDGKPPETLFVDEKVGADGKAPETLFVGS